MHIYINQQLLFCVLKCIYIIFLPLHIVFFRNIFFKSTFVVGEGGALEEGNSRVGELMILVTKGVN
jgi:hypothetical protein